MAAFCRLGGTRGTSKKAPGCRQSDGCDRLEALLEAFRRPSVPWPATNETSRGDDGCDTRLGDELGWLWPEGDCGRCEAFAVDMALCSGMDKIGLPSSCAPGDVTPPNAPGVREDEGLVCTANASARSFWITSLLALPSTGRFL